MDVNKNLKSESFAMSSSLFSAIKMWKDFLYSSATSSVWLYHKALGHTGVGPSIGTLSITDDRTGRKYIIPIKNNSVKALDFIQITSAGLGTEVADHYDNSLRILDKGFWNTACTETSITHM
jgi:citrate synthase